MIRSYVHNLLNLQIVKKLSGTPYLRCGYHSTYRGKKVKGFKPYLVEVTKPSGPGGLIGSSNSFFKTEIMSSISFPCFFNSA